MEGGNLFRVRTDARTRVRAEMAELLLHKNEVGGYTYNDAKTLAIQIERVLERQLFEDSSDGMKELVRSTPNTLTKYRANINIKKKDVIAQSAAAAADASTAPPALAIARGTAAATAPPAPATAPPASPAASTGQSRATRQVRMENLPRRNQRRRVRRRGRYRCRSRKRESLI